MFNKLLAKFRSLVSYREFCYRKVKKMSRFSTVLIPSCEPPITINGLAASTASALISPGKNRVFVINATGDITIAFSNLSNPITANANYYRIPANQQDTLDTGNAFDSFSIYNLSGTTVVNVYIQILSVL
jgi:hypothetical protein